MEEKEEESYEMVAGEKDEVLKVVKKKVKVVAVEVKEAKVKAVIGEKEELQE